MATLYTVQAAGFFHAELTLDEAASLLGVDALELEWAIEEDGICSTLDDQGKGIVAVASGESSDRGTKTKTRKSRGDQTK